MQKTNKYSYLTFLLAVMLLTDCQTIHKMWKPIINSKNSSDMTEYESFDISPYKDMINPIRKELDYYYTKEDGTEVYVYWREGREADIREIPPKPYFHSVIITFYPDDSLQSKGAVIGSGRCRIGKWLECDEEGNCKIKDYEAHRGRFGYREVLRFLEKKKYINLRTGEGRETVSMRYSYENHYWRADAGKHKDISYIIYTLDGNTGKVLDEELVINPQN